jgi:hypothetical protein
MTSSNGDCEHCVTFSHYNCSDVKEEYIVTKGNGKVMAGY